MTLRRIGRALQLGLLVAAAPLVAHAASLSLSQTGIPAGPGDTVTVRADFSFDTPMHQFSMDVVAPAQLRLISVSGNPFVTVSINGNGPSAVLPPATAADFSFSGIGVFPSGSPSYGLDLVFAADPGMSAVLSLTGFLMTMPAGGAPVFTPLDDSLTVTLAAPVPAPPALALMLGAVAALAGLRRRA